MLTLLGLLCVSIVAIVLLIKKMNSMQNQFELDLLGEKKNAEEARKKAEAEIAKAREEAERQIREYKESLEIQRDVLMQKNEKSLMVDTLLSLGSLGERLTSLKESIDLVATRQLNYYNATTDVIVSNSEAIHSVIESIDLVATRQLNYYDTTSPVIRSTAEIVLSIKEDMLGDY